MERSAFGHTPPRDGSSETVRHLEAELRRQRDELADHVAGLHRTIGDLQAELDAARSRAEAVQRSVLAQPATVADRAAADTADRFEGERRALQHRLAAVEGSTSWRITAPLRGLATLLRARR